MAETPRELKYSKEHEWVRVEDGGIAVIGVTDFAQDMLGDIVFLQLPEEGAVIAQMAKIGEIESVKSVSDLFTPVSGEVTARNTAAIDAPEVVNSAPYGDGWLLRVRMSNPTELEHLLTAEEYEAHTAAQG